MNDPKASVAQLSQNTTPADGIGTARRVEDRGTGQVRDRVEHPPPLLGGFRSALPDELRLRAEPNGVHDVETTPGVEQVPYRVQSMRRDRRGHKYGYERSRGSFPELSTDRR